MKIYVDGNPKEVCCVADGTISRAPIDGENTNNVAEYRAILYGLYIHPEATEVCSDSMLIVNQLNGIYAVKKLELIALYDRVQERVCILGHLVEFTFVKGHENPAGKVLG